MIHLIRTNDTDVTLHTVDEHQRRTCTQALESTHIKCRILLKVSTTSLQGNKTIALTQNRVSDILGRAFVHVPACNDRDSRRRLGTGEVLVGTHLNQLISESHARAVLLCCRRQTKACKQ